MNNTTEYSVTSANERHQAIADEVNRIDEEMMALFTDALIVEFRPTVWNHWIVKAYMAFEEPADEVVSYSYFARHFNFARTN